MTSHRGRALIFLNLIRNTVIVDYYSNFIEVEKVKNIKSTTIINIFKQQFARYGIPEVMITDNGPAYASADFILFSRSYGFKHVTSSPLYPQSNGKAERLSRWLSHYSKKQRQTGKTHTSCSQTTETHPWKTSHLRRNC